MVCRGVVVHRTPCILYNIPRHVSQRGYPWFQLTLEFVEFPQALMLFKDGIRPEWEAVSTGQDHAELWNSSRQGSSPSEHV